MSRVDPRILPPSIADRRGRAFAEALRQAFDQPDFKTLLFERIDSVPDEVLPFLIREFSIEEFVEPGMTPAMIRRLLKGSYELHASKGFVFGVRRGWRMLGIDVVSWVQWFQTTPKGAPGTHKITVRVSEEIISGEGVALSERVQRALARMAEGMKRKSQDLAIRVKVDGPSVPVKVGLYLLSRLTLRTTIDPVRYAGAAMPSRIGMVLVSRIRFRTEVTI